MKLRVERETFRHIFTVDDGEHALSMEIDSLRGLSFENVEKAFKESFDKTIRIDIPELEKGYFTNGRSFVIHKVDGLYWIFGQIPNFEKLKKVDHLPNDKVFSIASLIDTVARKIYVPSLTYQIEGMRYKMFRFPGVKIVDDKSVKYLLTDTLVVYDDIFVEELCKVRKCK